MLTSQEYEVLKKKVKDLKNSSVKCVLDLLLKEFVTSATNSNPFEAYNATNCSHKPKTKKTPAIESKGGSVVRTKEASEQADGLKN